MHINNVWFRRVFEKRSSKKEQEKTMCSYLSSRIVAVSSQSVRSRQAWTMMPPWRDWNEVACPRPTQLHCDVHRIYRKKKLEPVHTPSSHPCSEDASEPQSCSPPAWPAQSSRAKREQTPFSPFPLAAWDGDRACTAWCRLCWSSPIWSV